jgi:hypothetical protein
MRGIRRVEASLLNTLLATGRTVVDSKLATIRRRDRG